MTDQSDRPRVLRIRFERPAQAHESARERQPTFRVVRPPLEEAFEGRASRRGPPGFEERLSAAQVDLGHRRVDAGGAVVVGECGVPLTVEAVELAAFHVEPRVVRSPRDLSRDFRDLFVKVAVGGCPVRSEAAQEEGERQRAANAPPGKPVASYKHRQTVGRS